MATDRVGSTVRGGTRGSRLATWLLVPALVLVLAGCGLSAKGDAESEPSTAAGTPAPPLADVTPLTDVRD